MRIYFVFGSFINLFSRFTILKLRIVVVTTTAREMFLEHHHGIYQFYYYDL